jgi:hypothetical protein
VDAKKAFSKVKGSISVSNASMDAQSVIPIPILALTVEITNISRIIFAILVLAIVLDAQMELYAQLA